MRKGCPVRIRGITYISQRAAAEALGVHPATIAKALDDGCIDQAGQRKGGQPCKPCVYRGKAFPSRKAAAEFFGVSIAAVSKAVRARKDRRAAA